MSTRCCVKAVLVILLAAQRSFAGPKEDAARAFAEAARLYRAEQYAAAIKAFERAYALKPHHVVLCNIARSHERLEDFVKAADHYRRCLEEGGAEAKDAERIRSLLKGVQARITMVYVHSAGAGGTVYLEGKPVGPAPQRLQLNPGEWTVEVQQEGARRARSTVTARGGEALTVRLVPEQEASPPASEPVPEPPPPEPPPKKGIPQWWFWTGVVATVGLSATAIVLGAQALGLKSNYEEAPTRAGYEKAKDRRLLTNIFWGAAAAAGVTSTVLFFFTDFGSKHDESVALGIGLRGVF